MLHLTTHTPGSHSRSHCPSSLPFRNVLRLEPYHAHTAFPDELHSLDSVHLGFLPTPFFSGTFFKNFFSFKCSGFFNVCRGFIAGFFLSGNHSVMWVCR